MRWNTQLQPLGDFLGHGMIASGGKDGCLGCLFLLETTLSLVLIAKTDA